MEYNNKMSPLILPEYGRNVQQMVDICIKIKDKEECEKCAKSIVKIMQNVSPEHKKNENGDNVYWDHLAVMSNFSLDINFPEGTITKDKISSKVIKTPYQGHFIKFKYYGHLIEDLISKVVTLPIGEERKYLEYQTALHMKKLYLSWNKDNVDDVKIFKDLFEMSDGQIMLTPENCILNVSSSMLLDNKAKSKMKNKKNNKRKQQIVQ